MDNEKQARAGREGGAASAAAQACDPAGFEPVGSPRVDATIAAVMKRHPGKGARAEARYFEAVHQELAPLARELEQELQIAQRARDDAIRAILGLMKVAPENVNEDAELRAAYEAAASVITVHGSRQPSPGGRG